MRCSRQEDLMAALQLAAGQQQPAVGSVQHARAESLHQSQHETTACLCDAAAQATAGQGCMQVRPDKRCQLVLAHSLTALS